MTAQLIVGDRQIHLDVIDAGSCEGPDVGAGLLSRPHVAAVRGRCSQRPGHSRAGHEHAGPLDPSAPQGGPLREAPRCVVVDIGDGRDAVWEEQRKLVVAEVDMAVNQAGQDGPAAQSNHGRVRWIGDLAPPPNGFDASPLDDNDRVGYGASTGAVNQRSAFENKHAVLSRGPSRTEQNSEYQGANP